MEATYYPSWLDPAELWLPQGLKNAPVQALPDSKLFTVVNKRSDITSASIIGRSGVRAVMDTGAADNDRINWNHSNLFNNSGGSPYTGSGGYSTQNLSQQQVINTAGTVPLGYAEADELAEGDPWGMPFYVPQMGWWYDARKALYDAAGKTYRNFGTYGSFSVQNGDPWEFMTGDGSNKQPNHAIFKATLQSQAAARKRPAGGDVEYFSLFFSKSVGAIIKHYADRPDYASRYYNKAYAAEQMALGMGATRGIPPALLIYLDWGKIEGLGSENADLHNGYFYERQVGSLGRIRYEQHPQVDFDWQVGNIFGIGFCRTSGYIIFDDRIRYGTNPLVVPNPSLLTAQGYSFNHQWIGANGTAEPVSESGYPIEPQHWQDAGFVAANLYRQCARTEGEPWQYCEYKIAGTENWITPPSDHTAILEHASANDGAYAIGAGTRRGRADAMFRVKGSAIDVWAFDPSRSKQTTETIILRPVPNKEISVTLPGMRTRLFNETV